MTRWTTPADVRAKVQRRWDDQTLLRALAAGEDFPAQDFPIRGPKVSEIGVDVGAVRDWIAALEDASRQGECFEIEWSVIGGREIGRNRFPTRARLTSYDQAWALLGAKRRVASYVEILELVSDLPVVRAWVGDHPLKSLDATDDWESLLAAYRWLAAARGSGLYLRTIDAPGVDTKFVERHRPVLGQLLGAGRRPSAFARDLGLAAKPDTVRMRFCPGFLGLPRSVTEATFRVDEIAGLQVGVGCAVVVENEVTFLSLDPPNDGVLLWGKGFDVDRVGALRWLADVPVWYWGDLDTHGFAILDQLRAWLPQTESFLMDRATLLEHRQRWGSETGPTSARLGRLATDEASVYTDLVTDRYGNAVRLEQERIAWGWATERLPYQRI
ncbi:DUF3322 domain-containing protein [Solicola gregarius]|uniref:DUF2220 family protein n=1 Tax=Solicola gregarius TaxID=2908642 RepID=A0AA46YLG1_9ACTN|nr:Wadjet anti-phage system protein JetD domain-containing protein [Solicola gregarius]UYM05471.1 DUF2220 family protein [Solicola gregarius]